MLLLQLRIEDGKGFQLPGSEVKVRNTPDSFPRAVFIEKRGALRVNERLGTTERVSLITTPYRMRVTVLVAIQPTAPTLYLQAGFPATVAVPPGLVGELKMESDD